MPFATGALVGPYEILAPIGAGGMGEVWKARDTRLDRIVAIKTSHTTFSDRFEREARAIAALNHPNICQIYDVGPDYLVMEYVEGMRLAPVDSTRKLLDIAVQLSDGLAAAHAARIIHRDLKPDNILITRDGRVKILDFGLAKNAAAEIGPDDVTRVDLTDAGSTVGTIAYMSPEQARGDKNLTAQSDQFSMGLVLYELATGKQAFRRRSAAETMTAIIREDAEPLPATVPAPLRWIVERLLSKEPAERYDSTRDLYRELRQVRDRLSEATVSGTVQVQIPPERAPVRTKSRTLFVGIAAAVLASAATWFVHPSSGSGRQQFTPMEVTLENPLSPVWSPDGKAFAYSAGAPGSRRVLMRYLNSPTPTPLTPASDGWGAIGWSPDSKRVIVLGKNPHGDKPPNALFAVPVFGGPPDLIAPLETIFGAVSGDGKTLGVIRREEDGTLSVNAASPVGSPLKRYTPAPFEAKTVANGSSLSFSPDGRSILLFMDVPGGRQAWRLPYPAGSGAPRRILKDLPTYGPPPFLSWLPGGRSGVMQLQESQGHPVHLWIAGVRSGARRQVTSGMSDEYEPAVSPDGTKILFVKSRPDYMIVSASLSDATVDRVISSEIATGMPAWAPHQEKFVYVSERNGSPAIWMRAEGWDRPLVTEAPFPPGTTHGFMTPALSPGADRVIYGRSDKNRLGRLWISSVSGGPPIRLTDARNDPEDGGSWSPDGARFVYVRRHNDLESVMVVKTSGEAMPAVLRENAGIRLPEWSPDGQWIKFLDRPGGAGWTLISPDGKTVRTYGEPNAISTTFSADSTHLYGIRSEQDHRYLFSFDIATKGEKIIGDIGREFTPVSYIAPGIRLSLSPDGKRILFPAYREADSLWMLEGFDPPNWMERLREMLPW